MHDGRHSEQDAGQRDDGLSRGIQRGMRVLSAWWVGGMKVQHLRWVCHGERGSQVGDIHSLDNTRGNNLNDFEKNQDIFYPSELLYIYYYC